MTMAVGRQKRALQFADRFLTIRGTARGLHSGRSLIITRNNFRSLLDSIRADISNADFLAIDTRLTGTLSAPWRKHNVMDSLEISYHKLKNSAERFTMLEFGLCTFRWQLSQQKFVAQPFNFYLFPQDNMKLKLESESFLCETSSLEHMARSGFNFNTCIQHGISYMSKDQESMMGAKVDFQFEDCAGFHMLGRFRLQKTNDGEKSAADKMFSQHLRDKIMHWRSTIVNDKCVDKIKLNRFQYEHKKEDIFLGTAEKNRKLTRLTDSSLIWFRSYESPHLSRASLKLESLGHHELLVLLEVIQHDFKDLVAVVQPENPTSTNKNVHLFYVASHEERIILLEELEYAENKEKTRKISELIGFRHIIDTIVDSKKPVVGHDCLADLAHIFKNFFQPLPLNVTRFANDVMGKFPCIIDTKYLLQNIPDVKNGNNTELHDVCFKLFGSHGSKISSAKIEISHDLRSKRCQRILSKQDQNNHDSGSNAYLAGCLFAHICNITNTNISDSKNWTTQRTKTEIGRYMNRLCMPNDSTSAIDLSTGSEVESNSCIRKKRNTSNILLLWGYPNNTSLESIKEIICGAVQLDHQVAIYPLDDSSALVELNHCEEVEKFLAVVQNPSSHNGVESSLLLAGSVRAATFAAYQFLCKYSPSIQRVADCAEDMQLGSAKVKILGSVV